MDRLFVLFPVLPAFLLLLVSPDVSVKLLLVPGGFFLGGKDGLQGTFAFLLQGLGLLGGFLGGVAGVESGPAGLPRVDAGLPLGLGLRLARGLLCRLLRRLCCLLLLGSQFTDRFFNSLRKVSGDRNAIPGGNNILLRLLASLIH